MKREDEAADGGRALRAETAAKCGLRWRLLRRYAKLRHRRGLRGAIPFLSCLPFRSRSLVKTVLKLQLKIYITFFVLILRRRVAL